MGRWMITLAVLFAPALAEAHDIKLWYDDGDKKAQKTKAPEELAAHSPEVELTDGQGITVRVTMAQRDTRGVDRRDGGTGVHAARVGTVRSAMGIPYPLLTHKKWYSANGFTARTVRDRLLPALDGTCLAGRIRGVHWTHDDLWIDGYMMYEVVWKAHLDVTLDDGTTLTWQWEDSREQMLAFSQHELTKSVHASAESGVAAFTESAKAYCASET